MDKQTEKLLRTIPGIGPRMAKDLWDLGIRTLADLAAQNPEEMFERLRVMAGGKMDRCVLYDFRSAVYFAKTPPEKRDPVKLKWWTWKDA